MATETQLRVKALGEEIYEFFLREAGEYSNPNEWYELAMGVAYQFQEMIRLSARRNLVTLSSLSYPSGDLDRNMSGDDTKWRVVAGGQSLPPDVRLENASPAGDAPAKAAMGKGCVLRPKGHPLPKGGSAHRRPRLRFSPPLPAAEETRLRVDRTLAAGQQL